MNAALYALAGFVLGGFLTAWIMVLVVLIRATRGGDK